METDPRLLEALASLNQIGATINQIGPDENFSVEVTLQLIVESATRVVPASSAVIYTYDEARGGFNQESRVSADNVAIPPAFPPLPSPANAPRPQGLGTRAMSERRRVLSYEEPDLQVHPEQAAVGVRTVGCFPLIVAGQAVGALYVYLREDRSFNRLELLMLDNFVNQAAMAIYHTQRLARMRRDLARKEDELNRLRRAGLLISSRLRLEETLEAILQMALEVTNAHYGIFRLLDKTGRNLLTRAIAGERLARPLVEALPLDSSSVMGQAARTRQPILIADLREEPWAHIYYPLDADMEMRSELAVPLIGASGRLEGVLNLESPQVSAFNEDDSHLLQALATQAVTAIQEVRLLDALQEVARLLLTRSSEEVLQRITDLACDLLNATRSAVWRLRGAQLIIAASSGGGDLAADIPPQNNLASLAVARRSPVTGSDLFNDASAPGLPPFNRDEENPAERGLRSLVVPLLTGAQDEPLGAFGVCGMVADGRIAEPGRFAEAEWDTKVLTCLAHYAALAFQNAARQDDLRAAQEQRSVAETFAAVGDIASNLLHHLNNKVGTIPVRVQGIQDKCKPALDADSYLSHNLDQIERCASEAMETVRENLSHLRPIRLEPVYVAARVMDAIHSAKLPPGIRVQTENLDALPVVMAGSRSLTFVFTNLFENAAAAIGGETARAAARSTGATDSAPATLPLAHGVITIRGYTDLDSVVVEVSDDGPGITPELHDRIFELNFSASGRSNTRSGKLGFGLWWVKTLMTRLGGSITVHSDGRHGGTFSLRLPRAEKG